MQSVSHVWQWSNKGVHAVRPLLSTCSSCLLPRMHPGRKPPAAPTCTPSLSGVK